MHAIVASNCLGITADGWDIRLTSKPLGDHSSIDDLYSSHLDATADTVLGAIRMHQDWVSTNLIVSETLLTPGAVLTSVTDLASAGLVKVRSGARAVDVRIAKP